MEGHEVVIIGSGPAGLTAALYAARANLNPVVLEGIEPGGQLTTTTDVENYPGFPDGIMGPELMDRFRNQAKRFGATCLNKTVTNVKFGDGIHETTTDDGITYKTKTVIISTGASAKYLGLDNEKELIGKGVSACATCDGFFYRDQVVHVIGGGDTAMEEATFLTKFASKVYVIHRRDTLRASKPMQERAMKNEKIEFLWNTAANRLIFDDNGLTGVEVKDTVTGELQERNTNGLFYGIGHHPNTEFLKDQLKLDDHGFIETLNGGPETSIPGVFACGDVQDSFYRQAITAAGSGCQAAIKAERFLSET